MWTGQTGKLREEGRGSRAGGYDPPSTPVIAGTKMGAHLFGGHSSILFVTLLLLLYFISLVCEQLKEAEENDFPV